MANGITARLFGRPRTYKPIGLDDGADLSRSTGAASTGSQVAEPRSPYAAPTMPSRGDYVPQADIEKYYSMLGSAPQRKDPGKASQVLSVLSDIFLNKDIPGTLREGGYQREQERYKSQLDPLKAKLDAGEQAYETEADRVSKQGALDLGAYNANKPTEPHYYGGLDKGGKPVEMSSRPGEEPTVLGPRYEPPPARPAAAPAPHYYTGDQGGKATEMSVMPGGEPQVVGPAYVKPTASDDTPIDVSHIPVGTTGQDVLKALDPQTSALVKGIGDYEMNPVSVTSLRGGNRERVMALVRQYNPTYDQTQYSNRASFKQDLGSGKLGTNIRGLNTAISHMREMKDAAGALDNYGGVLTPLNRIKNPVEGFFGAKEPGNFETTKSAVVGELAGVFKASGATDSEIAQWQNKFQQANSPEQFQGAMGETVKLLRGRLQAIDDQYQANMGTPRNFHILSPDSARALQDVVGPEADQLLIFDGYDPKNISAGPGPRTNQGTLAPRAGQSAGVLSQAAIQQAARDHGVSVEEATRQAKESGYEIK